MAPLGWKWAAAVWIYALAWFLISDRIKLLAYRILDPAKKAKKTNSTSEPVRDLTPTSR